MGAPHVRPTRRRRLARLSVVSILAVFLSPEIARAQTADDRVVAARTIRAGTVLSSADLRLAPATAPGALTDPGAAIGQETLVAIYAGRPIHPTDLGPPALVDRNQIVRLVYRSGGLSIVADGRALGRAAEGETVRVMNLSSRATVTGTVGGDGTVQVVGATAF